MKLRDSTTPVGENRTDRELAHQWNSIDWDEVKSRVNRLQTRIAKATHEDKWNLVKRLQYMLTHSYSAKLIAVRIVTQNRGKRTPGVDGELWKTASKKMQATLSLTDQQYHAQPLRRVYIPKPGKTTKRPISIPTMYDRAMQALYALALQPIAETTADSRSFGFRLFRCAQDASDYAFKCLYRRSSSQWIVEGDIKSCFDAISHDWLMRNIPMNRPVLSQFLKAGFVFDERLFPTDMGNPQGGLVSQILANMALDGIEETLSKHFPKMKVYFIRYADDFVVTVPTEEIANEIREVIRAFLIIRGLELSPEKTKITHISEGFDFLGWNIRKFNATYLTQPSKKSVESITQKIRSIVRKGRAWTQDELIKALNPVIRGWANYHRHIVAKKTFKKLDNYLWTVTWRWAQRRHSNKGRKWIVDRYWQQEGNRNWVFQTQENKLLLFSDFTIRRHAMPKLEMNPYLDRKYFLERKERIKRQTPWIQTRLSFFAFRRPALGL